MTTPSNSRSDSAAEIQGSAAAQRIADNYVHHGAKSAEESLFKDYMSQPADVLKQEKLKLAERDKTTQILGHVAIEWLKPQMQQATPYSAGQLQQTVTDMSIFPDNRKALFTKDMAEVMMRVAPQVENPQTFEIPSIRLDSVEEQMEAKRLMAEKSTKAYEIFAKNDGQIFNTIAGDSGVISKETLQKALELGRFKGEDQKDVQWMLDNWNSDAVNQLKIHRYGGLYDGELSLNKIQR